MKKQLFSLMRAEFFLQMESLRKGDITWFELLLNPAILLTTSSGINKKQHAVL